MQHAAHKAHRKVNSSFEYRDQVLEWAKNSAVYKQRVKKIKNYKPPEERKTGPYDAKLAFVHFVTNKLFKK